MSTQVTSKHSKTESVSATTRPQKAAPLGSGTASNGDRDILLVKDIALQLHDLVTATGLANRRLLEKIAAHGFAGPEFEEEIAALRASHTTAAKSVTLPPIEEQHLVAQYLMDETPIRRMDPVVEKLQRRTVDAVLNGASWLTSREVGARAAPNAANKHALASRLLKEGRVFAIERAGRKEFPDYVFDPLGNPLPVVREVLSILDGYTPFRLASWFESKSARLAGRRPREVLATDPDAVIVAAREHLQGPVHG